MSHRSEYTPARIFRSDCWIINILWSLHVHCKKKFSCLSLPVRSKRAVGIKWMIQLLLEYFHIDFFLIWTISLTESFACLWCEGRAVIPEILPLLPAQSMELQYCRRQTGYDKARGARKSGIMSLTEHGGGIERYDFQISDIEPMPRGWKWNQSSK